MFGEIKLNSKSLILENIKTHGPLAIKINIVMRWISK